MDGKNPVSDAALPRRIWLEAPAWRTSLSRKEQEELKRLEDEDFAARCGPVTVRKIAKKEVEEPDAGTVS